MQLILDTSDIEVGASAKPNAFDTLLDLSEQLSLVKDHPKSVLSTSDVLGSPLAATTSLPPVVTYCWKDDLTSPVSLEVLIEPASSSGMTTKSGAFVIIRNDATSL